MTESTQSNRPDSMAGRRRYGWQVPPETDTRLALPPDNGWAVNVGLTGSRLRQVAAAETRAPAIALRAALPKLDARVTGWLWPGPQPPVSRRRARRRLVAASQRIRPSAARVVVPKS